MKLSSDDGGECHNEEEEDDDDDDDKDLEKWVLDLTEKSEKGDFKLANLMTEKEEEGRFSNMVLKVGCGISGLAETYRER